MKWIFFDFFCVCKILNVVLQTLNFINSFLYFYKLYSNWGKNTEPIYAITLHVTKYMVSFNFISIVYN